MSTMSICDRIRKLRESKGLSMNQLERLIGASTGSVNKWEKGSIPGGKYILALSEFFGVSSDWILKGTDPVGMKPLSYEENQMIENFVRLAASQKKIINSLINELIKVSS